jgi:hypothetical protein
MKNTSRLLLVLSVLLAWGCGLIAQSARPAEVASATAATSAETAAAGAPEIDTHGPRETPEATIPPLLTLVPGISGTLTAVYSTPGAEKTLLAQQTVGASANATAGLQLRELSRTLLKQCPNPTDSPMPRWLNIPVMPEATAGQVVQTLAGPYYCFRAPVTVEQMESFYETNLQAPSWVQEEYVSGSMEFIGLSQSGIQLLFIGSGPGNQNDLIVVINITRALSLPTSKP